MNMALQGFIDSINSDFSHYSDLNLLLDSNGFGIDSNSLLYDKDAILSNDFDSSVNNYFNTSGDPSLFHNFDATKGFEKDINEISVNIEGILATGGYVALMEYYSKNPEKQKKITKIAIGLGLLDTFIEKGASGIEADFALSPLLVASLAYFIADLSKNAKDPTIKKLALQFTGLLGSSMKVIEYTGYAALTVSAIIKLSEIGALGEHGDNLLDFLDNLGDITSLLEDGVDLFAGIGLGYALKKAVRWFSENSRKEDVERLESLMKSTASKRILVKFLEANAPLMIIIAPYNDVFNKK